MKKLIGVWVAISLVIFFKTMDAQTMKTEPFQPLSYEQASKNADSVLALMTLDEKIAYIGGDRSFFLRPIPRLNLSEVYMSDATQGVHIRDRFINTDLSKYMLEKSTAFPCPLLLAATWNTELSHAYAQAVGEECRKGNIGFLLGPGMNSYRVSQCGRNFEYLGEDPYLRSRMIENYVKGLQSTGTIATLKHFVANNEEFFRRKSNSIVDERTLHEIYLPPFQAGIDAGAHAVMTSYNQLNGSWCGQNSYVIDTLLRKEMGFQWLVMTDWWSVYDGEKVIKSGQNLEMPAAQAMKNAKQMLEQGKISITDIDRMVKSILRTYYSMRLDEPKNSNSDPAMYDRHEEIALQTAREGIVLLKNDHGILPLKKNIKNILVTGDFVDKNAAGGGSAEVAGYNQRLLIDELKKEYGKKISFIKNPTDKQIQAADVVLCNIGTLDSEGWDHLFAFPDDQEKRVQQCVDHNPNTVILVNTGSGRRMTSWNAKARAILYSWYAGQNGNTALVEILSGKTNPSGKLPITIEKEYSDSPGSGYMPAGEKLYVGWNSEQEEKHLVFDIRYSEGIFTGYRWYEKNKIKPLYPFGFGLSYTQFDYSKIQSSKTVMNETDTLFISATIKNNGDRAGKEIVQLYIQDTGSSVPRPMKELKGMKKVFLKAGKSIVVNFPITVKDLSYWNTGTKNWAAQKGQYHVLIGSSSNDIKLQTEFHLQ